MIRWDAGNSRLAVLAEGAVDPFTGKTLAGLLRDRSKNVVAVVDAEHAGGDLAALMSVGAGIPIVARLGDALRFVNDGDFTNHGFVPDTFADPDLTQPAVKFL